MDIVRGKSQQRRGKYVTRPAFKVKGGTGHLFFRGYRPSTMFEL